MNNSAEILNELKTISPLIAGLEKVNVFQVPKGYFNELHLRITNHALFNNSVTENINNPILQQVPAGYFDTLSDSILAKVKAAYPESAEEELRKLSPMLYSLQGENIFTVPRGYFESFPGEIIEKVKQPAKIVAMKKRNSWWKYAAAAVIAGVISAGALQIFNNSSNKPGKSIVLKEVSLPEDVINSFKYKTEDDVATAIAKLDDADIIKYLEAHGNIMDNELLINNTDVSGMPSQTDYLTDENTLNKYLDKIDAENIGKSTP